MGNMADASMAACSFITGNNFNVFISGKGSIIFVIPVKISIRARK
jgi:hypothetical protein